MRRSSPLALVVVFLSPLALAAETNLPADKAAPPTPDVYKYAGLPPDKAAAAMTVPEGFSVSLLAGEPDVCQPIAFCLDDRGRLWVAEAYSYPQRRDDKDARDRIVIFEDTKEAGHFDKRTVFMEGLNLVSGLEVGFGGVWIGAAPYLMFVPVKDGEDRPAGKPEILLDGWHYEDTHEVLNTFRWGPDGWLYGCHGVFTHSLVGKPGTPDDERTPINAGVWRYHPTKRIFEVFSEGTSNPWGLDFDQHGQAFVTACVIPHAYHMIQGGRYQRQAGDHFNPYTYGDIQTIADHLHWQGKDQWAGNLTSGSLGGGHAHCGLMLYQGGAWPQEFVGQMLMGNVHGHRLNMDLLRAKGSGFVASHGPDFLMANDAWARFINMRYGPDGNVYLIDWYDKQACHNGDADLWDRSNGRIYKISYRGTQPATDVDLAKKSDKELADLLLDKNEWYVRHALRLLQERAKGETAPLALGVYDALAKITFENKDETRRLRGLWALHAAGGLTEERMLRALSDESPYVRAWTIQLALEGRAATAALTKRFTEMAAKDESPVVRLYLASGMGRLPPTARWEVLAKLVGHGEDAADHNLPLLYWYAAEPLAAVNAARALELAAKSKLPQLLPFMARRVGALASKEAIALLVGKAGGAETAPLRLTYLRGLQDGLKGRREAPMPDDWPATYGRLVRDENAEVRGATLALAVLFGDQEAFKGMRNILISPNADLAARQDALAALRDARDKELPPVLHRLLDDKALRGPALRALAVFDDPKTPEAILTAFGSLTAEEKRDALNTLAARPAYGKALLDALAAKKVAANDVPADVVRQLRNLKDKELDTRIGEVWGVFRTTPADRAKLITQLKNKINATAPPPDLALGRAVFAKTCQKCHTLYGVGGRVGPDITGSNRPNLDYLLENIIDPSAVIPNDYKATVLTLQDGRVITGIVRGETPVALTVVTANETLTVPLKDIDTRKVSDVSMMPEDQLKPMSDMEVRALIAYLRNPTQTPILATADTAAALFNGKDLTGWDGDPKVWSVQDGEIVGKSPGGKQGAILTSQMIAEDFRLTFKVKLTPDKEGAAVLFHAEALPESGVNGPQAGIGAGRWGKLTDGDARGSSDKTDEKSIKADDWNDYEVVAEGGHVRTLVNGKPCADLDNATASRRGLFALQILSGGEAEVRFKDFKLEALAPAAPEK